MDLTTLLQQDNVRISERPETPERANYACPLCGGYDRFVIWKNKGRFNAGRYWCNQCHISGDIISYLMEIRNLTYPEALDFMGGIPVTTTASSPVKQKGLIQSNYKWAESSQKFVVECNQVMNNYPFFQKKLLKDRGITLETVNRFMLGWNLTDRYLDRTAWNMPTKLNEDGKEKKLFIPAGLVIPHYNSGFISCIRIRREQVTENYGKYYLVGATGNEPLRILPYPHFENIGVIITEGELDAIRLAQEFDDEDIIGMASASSGIPRDTMAYQSLFDYQMIALCFDNDSAGRKAAENLKRFLSHAYYIPVPKQYGKDITEAFQNGLSPKDWEEYVNTRLEQLINSAQD